MESPYVLSVGRFWNELDSFPPPQLESLFIYGWPKLKSLPEQIQHLTSLTDLTIESFEGVEAIPDWLGNLTYLQLRESHVSTFRPSYAPPHQIRSAKYLAVSPSKRKTHRGKRPRVA
ncbi:hypothetical protein ACLB2K_065359 [Fragaria x ananassa]